MELFNTKTKGLILFAKPIWIFTIPISALISFSILASHTPSKRYTLEDIFALSASYLFVIKLIVSILIALFFHLFQPNRYLFFYNLRLSKSNLWLFVLGVDLLIYSIFYSFLMWIV